MCLSPGEYEYYHYLQPTGTGRTDKYDDNGWGCAYRSLQSIISWSRLQRYPSHLSTSSRERHSLLRNRFRLQRYTSHPNPSHYQIQKTLVDHCGQEADGLLGKRTWLGSQAIGAPPHPHGTRTHPPLPPRYPKPPSPTLPPRYPKPPSTTPTVPEAILPYPHSTPSHLPLPLWYPNPPAGPRLLPRARPRRPVPLPQLRVGAHDVAAMTRDCPRLPAR